MALDYFEWEAGDVIVLHLSGPVTLGQGTRKFRDLIDATLKSGKKKILLNMSEVYNMDSSGLGELVAAHTNGDSRGRHPEAGEADAAGARRGPTHQDLSALRSLRG